MNAPAITWQRHDVVLVLLVFVTALGARVVYLAQIEDSPLFAHPIGDSAGFDAWAARIADGDFFGADPSDPGFTEQSAPLYPYFLGLVQALLGRDYLSMRLVQAVVGACSCVVLFGAGRAFAGRSAGAVAAVMLALYAPAIYYDGQLQKGVLGQLFLGLLLWLMGTAQRGAKSGHWSAMGLALGLLCLDRENGLLLAVVVLVWLGLRFRDRPVKTLLLWAGLFGAGLALTLLWPALRNLRATGSFTPGASNIGPNFFVGNNPRADGTYVALRPGHGSPVFERSDAREIAEQALGRELTPGEISDYWLGRGLDYVRRQPADWMRLMLRKWLLVWNRLEIADTEDLYWYAEKSSLLAGLGGVLHFGVVFPLAVAGTVWSWSRRRELWVLYALSLVMTGGLALFLVLGRYRIPLVPALLILCAAGLVQLPALWGERRRGLLAWGCAALLASAVVSNWPMRSRQGQAAAARTNLAAALSAQNRLDEAISILHQALAIDDTLPEAHHNLGNVWAKKEDFARAVAAYERALQLAPGLAETHNNLGDALRKSGRTVRALEQYRRAIELAPRYAQPHYGAGLALASLGRHDEAAAEYREAIRLRPDFAAAYNNLGNALSRTGRSREAMEAYRRALELDPQLSAAYVNLAAELADAHRYTEAVEILRQGLRAGIQDAGLSEMLESLPTEHPK